MERDKPAAGHSPQAGTRQRGGLALQGAPARIYRRKRKGTAEGMVRSRATFHQHDAFQQQHPEPLQQDHRRQVRKPAQHIAQDDVPAVLRAQEEPLHARPRRRKAYLHQRRQRRDALVQEPAQDDGQPRTEQRGKHPRPRLRFCAQHIRPRPRIRTADHPAAGQGVQYPANFLGHIHRHMERVPPQGHPVREQARLVPQDLLVALPVHPPRIDHLRLQPRRRDQVHRRKFRPAA